MIGVIADDFTGATDIAGLMARTGADVRMHGGIPATPPAGIGAVEVIALKCRTAPVDQAVADTAAALEWLLAHGARQIYWKYCSTFDSTDRGNIGPVAEALMARLGADHTVYCPAFPENGRTVYQGHLFVGDALLSDSPMRHHPLTPMTDSNLMRLLDPQVTQPVGLIPLDQVREGADAVARARADLVARGIAHLIADATADADLATLGQAVADAPLLTGGSAFAAAAYGPDLRQLTDMSPLPHLPAGPAIVLSGSCSAATRAQVARFRASGATVIDVMPSEIATDGAASLVDVAMQALGDQPVLVTSTAEPDALADVQTALGREAAGALVEGALAAVAQAARARGATRIVVAGGETSGAITLALKAHDLRVGPEIAPGVPWCFADDGAGTFALALKSGNFGGADFFTDALAALERLR
ncbi:MAG: 3-oxo-tetronate kinase [Pseudomonadota bacterium]